MWIGVVHRNVPCFVYPVFFAGSIASVFSAFVVRLHRRRSPSCVSASSAFPPPPRLLPSLQRAAPSGACHFSSALLSSPASSATPRRSRFPPSVASSSASPCSRNIPKEEKNVNADKSVDFGDHSYHAEQLENFYRLMFSHEVSISK